MHFAFTALLILALFAPGTALGQNAPGPEEVRAAFAAADSNGDGQVDREEFTQRMVEIFFHADVEKKGYVTRGQLNVLDEIELFERGDGDANGQLTLSEFIARRSKDFDKADTDSSGTLSLDEVLAFVEKYRE